MKCVVLEPAHKSLWNQNNSLHLPQTGNHVQSKHQTNPNQIKIMLSRKVSLAFLSSDGEGVSELYYMPKIKSPLLQTEKYGHNFF